MAESSTSAQRRDGERGAMLCSLVVSAPRRTKEKDPPRYGAQYQQDALWEGGNEALPPQWQQQKLLNDSTRYDDYTVMMASWNRPLPGVRLDYPTQLALGCEWHISPLGRSYFVNHNTKTTSWKKPAPERPPGSLTPECVIEGHSKVIWSLTCLGTSCNILSASHDGSIRQWTIDGKPVGRPWTSDGGAVELIAMSPDESMVVNGSADGRLRLWNIKKGSMIGDPWEEHDSFLWSLDWSPNAQEIASGSQDGIIRRWNPNTGRQIAPPIKTNHGTVYALKYSPQGHKFASSGEDKVIRVWSKDGELLMVIEGHEGGVTSLCWSKDGAHIFSASLDSTIRKWQSIDGKELVIFEGHANIVAFLCLSPDESHLVSAVNNYTVCIWDLKTNQPVGDPLLHDDEISAVVISPDGRYIVSAGKDTKVYIWCMDAALKHTGNDHSADESNTKPDAKLKERAARLGHVHQTVQPNNRGLAKYGKDFWDADTSIAPCHAAPPASSSTSLHWRSLFGSLRFSTRSADVPQLIPLQPRRLNFNLFSVGSSVRAIDVAAGRKKNRIAIAPPTAAELAAAEAAAAMQHTNGNKAGSSTPPGQPQALLGTQVSQGRPTETQGAGGETGKVSYEVRCCGLFFSCGRPTSHQS